MNRGIFTGPRILLAMLIGVAVVAVVVAIRPPAVAVETAAVSRGPLVVTIDELGESRVSDLYIVSAPATGRLTRVPLKPGDPVLANETVLAEIHPVQPDPIDARSFARSKAEIESLRAQLSAAHARIAELKAQQVLAEREFARAADLSRRGFVSKANLDRARAARDGNRAAIAEATQAADATGHSLDAARASLLTAGTQGGNGSVLVRSPVGGFVMRVPQESERVVVAGTPLLEIGDPNRMEIVADLLSTDAVRVRPGSKVFLEDWGGEVPLHGRVRRVEPFGFTKISALGVEEQRVNVVIDFTDPRAAWERIGHGYRTTVKIVVDSVGDTLKIPIGALFRTSGQWSLFVIGKQGRAQLRRVNIGRMNDEEAELVSGLSEGEQVILHPSDKVANGGRVKERQ